MSIVLQVNLSRSPINLHGEIVAITLLCRFCFIDYILRDAQGTAPKSSHLTRYYLMRTPTSGVRGVVDATNKFTRPAEVLWRNRDGRATL